MKNNTGLWILLGVVGLGVVGGGVYLLTRNNIGTRSTGTTDAQAAALIAQAQSQAAIQQAKSAEEIAKTQKVEWWQTALVTGEQALGSVFSHIL